ncbi:MarR family transcriptional regulator [Catenulispora sp. NL8]|uniref:MarR family transcriptional regulator n=1 Tax=Catenulispora pinistramenti TaxID=2705254 RepID=A0ABS5L5C6_9ACTN|nr:MarR family transcriptional regulator [Catenulispora pinistramenti]MBS2553550.1 MarR family transcriptional regulator [Catenulispora pinistramenti]
MPDDAELIFADHAGRFYARQYGFPPMAGRLLGYLIVCDPPQQTIAELAEVLMASRSAITGALKLLEAYQLVKRSRGVGERVDHYNIDPARIEPKGFDATIYQEQAALMREGLTLLPDDASVRRAVLQELAQLADFLSERLPQLADEWRVHRDALRAAGKLPDTGLPGFQK